MNDYARLDPYSARYDNGIDAKIVVMGNTGVGKTSLLQRYTQNKFEPKLTTSTTGAFFVTKKAYIQGLKVRLQLWDTAGQERFRSMAPMYYRGANAALLLYDITSTESFDDVRGWLEELKKNCSPDLIIYIVGAKADLYRHRQVTSDRARLCLHRWFPPPRPEPVQPPPPPPPSTLSYIRPRFTSFTTSRTTPPTDIVPKALDDQALVSGAALRRSNTGVPIQRPTATALSRANSTNAAMSPRQRLISSPLSQFGFQTCLLDDSPGGSSKDVIEEDEDEEDDQEWGLQKGMSLFEVSAKDDLGVNALFNAVITAIVARKDVIESENERKKRDSVMLSPVTTPTWASQADEEEKALAKAKSGYSCCSV